MSRKASEQFMQPEILPKQHGYAVECDGTWYVPGSVCGEWNPLFESGQEFFDDYIEHHSSAAITEVTEVYGWFGRYSAPGYLDCTDWYFNTNRAKLERELRDYYGSSDE